MTKISKKENNLNIAFLIKLRKVISLFVVFFLVMTIMDTVSSSSVFITKSSTSDDFEAIENTIDNDLSGTTIKERILQIKQKIRDLLDKASEKNHQLNTEDDNKQLNEITLDRDPKTFRRYTLSDAIKRYLTYKGIVQASLFMFYTNYSGYESQHYLKLYRFVDIDVNGDGIYDISVKIRLYPFLEKELTVSVNFEYLIKRLEGFPDIDASFEAYGELYFPGVLFKKQKGDRIRIGYESPKDEEIPSQCSITYKYLPNIWRIRERPEHVGLLKPGSSVGNSKLALILSYTNFQAEYIVSEVISRTMYDPAVKSKLTIGGNGLLGGRIFEFVREVSEKTKIDMTVSFEKNNTQINGYVKDLPEKVTFTVDQGKEGYIEFDVHGNPPTEIGICDDITNPRNFVYFKDLPTQARIDWERNILKEKQVDISFYTDGTGISLNGHFELVMNGSFDFNIASNENIDCSISIDRDDGYFIFERCAVDVTFSLSYTKVNTSFNLSFNLTRFFDKPFEIFFGKLLNEQVQFSLASKSFTLEDFNMMIQLDSGDFGIKADRLFKEKNGSILVNFSYVKDEGNITFLCELNVINGIDLYNVSLGFNGIWSPPQDIILVGNTSRIIEFFCESGGFDYYIAEDKSWGYFYFKGNFSYSSYRLFTINNITGGFKGKILTKTGNRGLNISWYTIKKSRYNITKINVSGMFFGLENFHIFYGDIIDFYVPHLYGNIHIKEACNESGYFFIELLGGQSYIDLNFSFNFSKEVNSSVVELILNIEDFHLDHGDKSAFFEAIWDDRNLSSLIFHSENNINLSIENMYFFLGRNDTTIFEIKKLSGYLKGYSGFDVDLSTPINSYITKKPKFIDSSDFTLSFELTDVELDFEIKNITATTPIGSIKIAAKTIGTAKFGFLNISRDMETIYTPTEVNVSWGNISFGFDAINGELDLYEFEYKNVDLLVELILSLFLPNLSGLPTTTFKIENLTFSGYSKIIIPLGRINNSISFLGFKFENDVDTYFNLGSIHIKFPNFPIDNQYTKAYLDNLKLGEGRFSFVLGFIGLYLEILVTKRIQGFEIGAEISNIFEFNISLDNAIEYFNLEYNPGINVDGINYLLIDTKNSTVGLNIESKVSSELINEIIDFFNNISNITIPSVESDKGIRLNHASLRADKFQVFLNLSSRPLYKGFLQIYGDGSIYHLVNNSWEPLIPGGDGFSFIIEENHLQLKFDMAIENYPIDFEVLFDSTGNRILLSGIFTVYSDDLTFDIWWNKENGFVKIVSSNNRSLEIEDFIFQFINDSFEKIDIRSDLISILDGSYNLLLDSEENIFELDYGGSIFSIEGFEFKFDNIRLNNYTNLTLKIELDSFSLSNGCAVFQTFILSDEYNWNIGSERGIDWFELSGLKGSIEGSGQSMIHFEAGIGLLKWNRSSDNFLKMKISGNGSEGCIKFDRHSDLNGSFTLKDAYIRFITPNTEIPIGTRLRSLTADYRRNDHEYLILEWKKEEYIDLTADIAASWKITFERFFDVFNILQRIDLISSSIDVNFSLYYEPAPDNDSSSFLSLNILEKSSFELLEIVNHYISRFDKIMTIGEMELEPGEISFYWLIDQVQEEGWIFIDNEDVTGEFTGLTLRKGFYKIRFLDASIVYPGETYFDFEMNNDSGSLYISNSAELEFSVLEFSEGIDFLRIERDIEFGVISMLPGEFKANWINITDDDFDKELKINNGIFELTFVRFVLQLRKFSLSLSLFKTDRVYDNDITILLRQRGQGDRGFSITTDEPLQFDLFSIKLSTSDWKFIVDLVELKADFNEWYLGMLDGKLTIGGNGSVDIAGLSRFINITFEWKGDSGQEQKLFSQYCSSWQDQPQTHRLIFDTTNCTEQLDIIYNTKLDELNIDSLFTIYPQKYLTLHFDINPEPIDNSANGHMFIDTKNEEIGNIAVKINKYVDYFDLDVGLYAEIELLKADDFYIWGEFVEIELFGMKFWVPYDWGKSGSIDFVNIGLAKLIFGNHETEIWPCTPKAIPDRNLYGVSYENTVVSFDISESEGFAFKLQWMRWDWNGDGIWDTGSEPNHWINYEELIDYDFSNLFENEKDYVKVYFQLKTVAAKSNIAEMTVMKGFALDVDIEYIDKLYEFDEFKVFVNNATSKNPVSNAYVEYHQFNIDGTENVKTNYTNSNGEASFIAFEVPYDYNTHYSTAQIFIEADGYFDCESELFIVYDTDADLHGYIRDFVTHKGISNVLIVAEPGGYYTYSEEYLGFQNGKFKLIVPPGIYDITASKAGFSSVIINDFNAIQGGYQYLGDIYLPPIGYGGLRGVLYDAIDNNEVIIGATVTIEISSEDDIVTTTNYYGEFPNNYPSSSDEYYSIDLEPGTYTVKFEMDNYFTYEEQIEIVAGEIHDMDVFLYPKWIVPSGHNNPSEWNNEDDAHDNNLNTASYTDIYWGSTWHWTDPLELILSSSLKCDKIKFYAKYIENRCDKTKVEIYYNNAWHKIYEGGFENKNWCEIDFGNEYTIIKARVSFCIRKYLGMPTIAELFEFNFGLVQQ